MPILLAAILLAGSVNTKSSCAYIFEKEKTNIITGIFFIG